MIVAPKGICRPGNPDPRCWSCNYTGGPGINPYSEQRRWDAMTAYEFLLEVAESLPEFSISDIWRLNGKGHPEFNYARHVVHDLWFHRMTEPAVISRNGVVRRWRWQQVPGIDLDRNSAPDTRMFAEIAAKLRVDRGALIRWVAENHQVRT